MIKMNECLACEHKCCADINTGSFIIPPKEIDPGKIKVFMVSEVPPEDLKDYYYSGENSSYVRTTVQAFNDAGISVSNIDEIIELGVYITTAVKCGKTKYSIDSETVKKCSVILEKEMGYFENVKVYMLMGDVAIKAMNHIWKRQTGKKVIPSGSTYKIRKEKFYINGKRVFPSYLQTGGNYLIEKSKRVMIAEDLREAYEIIKVASSL